MLRNILWQPTGGYWLFWASAIYLLAGMLDVFVFTDIDYSLPLQFVWIAVLALPLVYKPLAEKLNMSTVWEK